MNINEMSVEELMERRNAIAEEIEAPEADLDALEEEVRSINAELEARQDAEAKKAELRAAVAQGEGVVVKKIESEERKKEMTITEVRNSEEYINAFAEYMKSGNDTECRALLSENATNGTVPVPTYVEGRIRTAWENSGIMNLVRKTFVKGNLKVGFEISATGAVIHTEGGEAVSPETLTLGVVTLIPQSIKKLIQISDEALDLTGREFLDYIYDELTYQIVKKTEEALIAIITDAPAVAGPDAAAVPFIQTAGLSAGDIIQAEGLLSAEASNPVVVTTRANWAALRAAALSANYAYDPFDGMDVHFVAQSALGTVLAIVGDFGYGAQANFPNGAGIEIKFDDRTDMASDLVNILGRQFVGLGVVANNAFVMIAPTGGSEGE